MLTDKRRRFLMYYFKSMRAYTYHEKRDRAMFLLMLRHNLGSGDIRGLRMNDIRDNALYGRGKRIELECTERAALGEYLAERMRLPGFPLEDHLFIEFYMISLTDEMIEDSLRYYIDITEGRL